MCMQKKPSAGMHLCTDCLLPQYCTMQACRPDACVQGPVQASGPELSVQHCTASRDHGLATSSQMMTSLALAKAGSTELMVAMS